MKALLLGVLLATLSPAYGQVPETAWQYQRQVIRAGWAYHGTDQYVSAMAGQVHQESLWDANATSWVGAAGLTQFMPATAKHESKRCGLGVATPLEPSWAILAQHCYMAKLIQRNYEFKDTCQRFAAALSGYNGGQGNVNKQRRKWADTTGHPANSGVPWFGGVENHVVRAAWAHKENRGYPRRILLVLTDRYINAGYGGDKICDV